MGVEGIDHARSWAVLIGVAEYADEGWTDVPAVRNSLNAMHAMLTDPDLGGWPEDRVVRIDEPTDPGGLAVRLQRLAQETGDVFLLYFVGHGTVTKRGKLILVLRDTEREYFDHTGLAYDTVKSILGDCTAKAQIVILDCCFSGRAIETLGADSLSLADSSDIRGVYTLTAADQYAHVVPLAEQADQCTSFTGEFVEILREGIPGAGPFVTFRHLYGELHRRLQARNLPASSTSPTPTKRSSRCARPPPPPASASRPWATAKPSERRSCAS